MTKTIEAKPVHEARAAARRMAKKTELTYQQALDRVARDAGAEHWAAFTARHPAATAGPAPEDAAAARKPEPHPRTRPTVGGYLRGMVSGEHAANEDRIRSAMIVGDAESFVIDLPADDDGMIEIDEDRVRRNLWWGAVKNVAVAPLAILVVGSMYAAVNHFHPTLDLFGFGDVARLAACAAGVSVSLFLACLLIGDQPGMERRRATAWTVMLWIQIVGVAAFFLNGLGAFDDILLRLTGITPELGFILGLGAILIGGEIRHSLHAVMALGAALGPKGEGSSFADLDAMMSAREEQSEEERLERKRNAPPHVPMTPEMARELGSKKPRRTVMGVVGKVLIGMVVLGCLLSFAGVVIQFGFGIDARPIGFAALAFIGPLVVLCMIGLALFFVADLVQLPTRWRKRMRQHQLLRAHERARGA